MDVASRADYVRQTPATSRFTSAEPLLGPVDDLIVDHLPIAHGAFTIECVVERQNKRDESYACPNSRQHLSTAGLSQYDQADASERNTHLAKNHPAKASHSLHQMIRLVGEDG
jgi:hypothetical protein